MNYIDMFDNIFSNSEFEKRLAVACLMATDLILNENEPVLSVEPTEEEATSLKNYVKRIQFARAILANPLQSARKMMPVMVVNEIIQSGNYTDDDILWNVKNSLENYAGVM
jgi:hypothetical protein